MHCALPTVVFMKKYPEEQEEAQVLPSACKY
jgi:hypothetical protein